MSKNHSSMTVRDAALLLGFCPDRDIFTLAGFARQSLEYLLPSAPLRKKVACQVLIDAADEAAKA